MGTFQAGRSESATQGHNIISHWSRVRRQSVVISNCFVLLRFAVTLSTHEAINAAFDRTLAKQSNVHTNAFNTAHWLSLTVEVEEESVFSFSIVAMNGRDNTGSIRF